MPETPTIPDTLPSLHAFFAPGGLLARSSLAYEYRPGQYEMARAVEQAFADNKHLIVEAGTGTGKTLAYLLPALRLAQQRGQRVVLSTGTKNLQEQLYLKDIPFLESLLGPLNVCYMKGRANYLCRHKLYALRDQPLLNGLEEMNHFRILADWERTTETGDRAEVSGLPENSPLWHKLDARTEACLGQSCPSFDTCFITSMRRRAPAADLVIVNHHLFFADLALRQEAGGAPDAGILPEAAVVIFDEAHELEDVASSYFGIGVTSAQFEDLARDTDVILRSKHVAVGNVEAATATLRDRSRSFFSALPENGYPGRMPFLGRADFLEDSGDVYLNTQTALKRLQTELDRIEGVDETAGLRKRAASLEAHLKFLLESTDRNTVFWIERRAAAGLRATARNSSGRAPAPTAMHTHVQATPIDVSELLHEALFQHYSSVILTSATLTVQGGFSHIRKRLGLKEARELVVPSHFRYAEQALLYLPPLMPDPRDPDFMPQAAERTRRVLELSKGRAFCLFTSYSQMREMYERMLMELPYPLLMQGTAPRSALIQQFRDTPNAVLFGTSSFWQGVDVQGEQLSCVIIDRLPFAVPSDPVVKARMEAIEHDGGKPFFDYQVPSAVITLKQGFGRLIRSLNDRGVLMLLDPRIQTARYGRIFLDSLPPYRQTRDIAEVERFFEQSLLERMIR